MALLFISDIKLKDMCKSRIAALESSETGTQKLETVSANTVFELATIAVNRETSMMPYQDMQYR